MGFTLQSPGGGTQFYGGAYLGEILDPIALNADVNDYDPFGGQIVDTLELTSLVPVSITGLRGGVDGRKLNILNVGPNIITLPNESLLSQAMNRFAFGSNFSLGPNLQILIQWNSTTQRWHSVGNAGSGGGFAPATASYLTLSPDAILTAERVLTAGVNISFVDTGPNGTLTINASGATVNASYLVVTFDGTLTDERRLQVGVGLTIVDGGPNADFTISSPGLNASFVVLGATADLLNERVLTPGNAILIVDGGAGAPVTISFDETVDLDNNARVAVRLNSGANTGIRRRLNFIDTATVTWTVTDDPGSEEVDISANASGSGGLNLTTTTINLGSRARFSGTFDIGGLVGLTPGDPVLITQAAGPYTGKGTRDDEAEMDQLTAVGAVLNATTIRAYWRASHSPMLGNIAFNFAVG